MGISVSESDVPYIKQDDREKYKDRLAQVAVDLFRQSKGDLNYCVTLLAWEWAKSHGGGYTNISNAVGALQDAAAELRRRQLDPYEDEKIAENGDAYEDIAALVSAIRERYQ